MSANALQQQSRAIAAEYVAALPERLKELDLFWRAVREDASPATVDALRRALHTLAGTAGTFGLAALTDSAHAAERFLSPHCAPAAALGADECAIFEDLLAAVRNFAVPQAP